MTKYIPVTVYLVVDAPGLSRTQWYATAEPGGDGPLYSAPELGEVVKLAVTDKFARMATSAMATALEPK